jgi:hypothetical protein
MKMRIRIHGLERNTDILKKLCRERRQRILWLEEKLKAEGRPCNIKGQRGSDERGFQGVGKQTGPSSEVEAIQCESRSSGHIYVQAGNEENSLGIGETLQRPRKNTYSKDYTHNIRR